MNNLSINIKGKLIDFKTPKIMGILNISQDSFYDGGKYNSKYKAIKHAEKMFKDGAVNEVKKFLKMRVNKELSSNKIIGIQEINDYLENKIELDKAKELIRLKTRQYAKRQFTWARGHMKSWEMIYSSNTNDLFKKAINKIS